MERPDELAITARRRAARKSGPARHICRVALLVLFTVLSTGAVSGAGEPDPLKGVALIIGQAGYENLGPLANPGNDARKIEALLNSLGFLTNVSFDRGARQLRRDIDGFIEDAEGADVALIYYSGHGIEAAGENYLVPVDGNLAALDAADRNLVAMSGVLQRLQSVAKITIVLLDACRTNPFPDGALLRTVSMPHGTPVATAGLGAPKGAFLRTEPSSNAENLGVIIGFAAEPGKIALDGEADDTSPYAAALLKHLGAPGAAFGDVMTMVTEEVYLKTRSRQRPWTNASLRRLLYFGKTAPEGNQNEARLKDARRDLLLTISATPQHTRSLVEGLAERDELPLGLLYGMLKELQVDTSAGPAAIEEQLRTGAQNLKKFMAERITAARKDPDLIRLSGLADRAELEGAIALAREYRAKASTRADELDKTLDQRQGELRADRLELAATYADEAETAILAFDYGTAIRQFAAAFEQAERWDDNTAAHYRLRSGDALSTAGNSKGALKAFQDALVIKQRLANADPDNTILQRDLTVAYRRVGDALRAQGKLSKALVTFRKAITISERLAREDANNTGLQRDLSVSHIRVGDALVSQGDLRSALDSFMASLTLAGHLAKANAKNPKWMHDLGISNERVGNVLLLLGNLNEALDAYQARHDIISNLAENDPGNALWRRGLAVSFAKLGEVHSARGDLARALSSNREAEKILESLVSRDTGNTSLQGDLSFAQEQVGTGLVAQGDLAGALESFRSSLMIRERLTTSDPNNTRWQHFLYSVLRKIADVELTRGELSAALEKLRRGKEIMVRLVGIDPDNTGWQQDVATSHSKIGDVLRAQDDILGALGNFQSTLTIVTRLASLDPDNARWQFNLSASHIKVGRALDLQGNMPAALNNYKAALSIGEGLAKKDSDNAKWQRHVYAALWFVADIETKQGKNESALLRLRRSREIMERLVKMDPNNSGWRYDLGISNERVGDVLKAQGKLGEALAAYTVKYVVMSHLSETDPGNGNWQYNLAISHAKIALIHLQRRKLVTALERLEAGRAIIHRLVQASPQHAGWRRSLDWFDKQIKALKN